MESIDSVSRLGGAVELVDVVEDGEVRVVSFSGVNSDGDGLVGLDVGELASGFWAWEVQGASSDSADEVDSSGAVAEVGVVDRAGKGGVLFEVDDARSGAFELLNVLDGDVGVDLDDFDLLLDLDSSLAVCALDVHQKSFRWSSVGDLDLNDWTLGEGEHEVESSADIV